MLCPVCNTVLRDHVTHCSSCPMHSGCDMLCCENCGYETVAPRSVTVEFFRRVWDRTVRRKSATPAPQPTASQSADGIEELDRSA